MQCYIKLQSNTYIRNTKVVGPMIVAMAGFGASDDIIIPYADDANANKTHNPMNIKNLSAAGYTISIHRYNTKQYIQVGHPIRYGHEINRKEGQKRKLRCCFRHMKRRDMIQSCSSISYNHCSFFGNLQSVRKLVQLNFSTWCKHVVHSLETNKDSQHECNTEAILNTLVRHQSLITVWHELNITWTAAWSKPIRKKIRPIITVIALVEKNRTIVLVGSRI